MFTRPFLNVATLTTRFVASGATSLLAPSNANRIQLKVQGADGCWVGIASGVPSGAQGMPGLFLASGAISPDLSHVGDVFVFSGAANGATVAIRAWESSVSG